MMKKYIFRRYEKKSPILFNQEKRRLERILPKDARIQHIGSTSVQGLGGKGIIDVMISVKKKDIKKTINNLEKNNYIHKPNKSKEREYFEKYKNKLNRFHIHLTYHDSFEFNRAVAFTHYLKNHPEAVKEYVKIKKEAVKYAKGEGKKYREYKSKTLKKLGRLALKEFNSKK